MELKNDLTLTKRVSWGSIIAGVVTVLAVSLLLTTLGTSLGLTMLNPTSDDIVNGAGKAVLIWSIIGVVVSLAAGGFIAGRLAGADGAIHGFLIWGTSLLVATVLGFSTVGGLVKTAGNAVGAIASATGSVASDIGNIAGKAASGTADAGSQLFNQLGLDTKLKAAQPDQQVVEALRKSNIPQLQPDYLQNQLQQAGNDVVTAAKTLAMHPDNSDAIVNQLTDKLKDRTQMISESIDRDQIKQALANNTSMTTQQSSEAVDNFIAARDKTVQEASQRIEQLQNKLDQAKAQYVEFKQQAKQQADAAAKAGAKIALWSFIALLLGAIVSSLAGFWGVNTHPARRNIQA